MPEASFIGAGAIHPLLLARGAFVSAYWRKGHVGAWHRPHGTRAAHLERRFGKCFFLKVSLGAGWGGGERATCMRGKTTATVPPSSSVVRPVSWSNPVVLAFVGTVTDPHYMPQRSVAALGWWERGLVRARAVIRHSLADCVGLVDHAI